MPLTPDRFASYRPRDVLGSGLEATVYRGVAAGKGRDGDGAVPPTPVAVKVMKMPYRCAGV